MYRYFPLSFSLSFSDLVDFWLLMNECNSNAGTGMGAAAVFERGDAADELCNARRVETNDLLSKDAM